MIVVSVIVAILEVDIVEAVFVSTMVRIVAVVWWYFRLGNGVLVLRRRALVALAVCFDRAGRECCQGRQQCSEHEKVS